MRRLIFALSLLALCTPANAQLQQYLPGPRLIDGSQLNLMVNAVNGLTAGTLAAPQTITGANANALDVGRLGATTPGFQVDTSTASSVTGIKIKSAAAAAGVAISVISSGTNENGTLDAKGSGTFTINGSGTGAVVIGHGLTSTAGATALAGTTLSGQLASTFGTPTIASGACGTTTNGTIAGTNQSGVITIGSATTTVCTVSFSATLGVAPKSVVIFPASAGAAATGTTVAYVSSITTGGFVITGSALASTVYNYIVL